jgi:hypothetical protein
MVALGVWVSGWVGVLGGRGGLVSVWVGLCRLNGWSGLSAYAGLECWCGG